MAAIWITNGAGTAQSSDFCCMWWHAGGPSDVCDAEGPVATVHVYIYIHTCVSIYIYKYVCPGSTQNSSARFLMESRVQPWKSRPNRLGYK